MTGIDFLNKVKDNWENVFIDFKENYSLGHLKME